jgi:predicted nucleotidyltransferase
MATNHLFLMKKLALPEDIKNSLKEFVEGVIDYEPLATIERIVLFGSLSEGVWNPEKSDIDLAVIVSEDPKYSYKYQMNNNIHPAAWQLVLCGCQRVSLDYSKLQVSVCIPSDFQGSLKVSNDGRGSLADAIQKGTPLYVKGKGILI